MAHPVTFHLRGLVVFLVFVAALGFALRFPEWGLLAVGGCILIEWFLLVGIGGWGRDGPSRDGRVNMR
jgi:hypothetical protein